MATHQEFRWQAGDRVLAPWMGDGFHYPGRVVEVAGDHCGVDYEDGGSERVPAADLLPLDLAVGARVYARWAGGAVFFPGVIDEVDGDRWRVRYDDGDEEWTTLACLRVWDGEEEEAPDLDFFVEPEVEGPAEGGLWATGDRVLARWADLYWYPGTILALRGRRACVLFDDGDQAFIPAATLMPLLIEEGEKAQVRPRDQPMLVYSPGVITRVDGERIDVEYEDGDTEQGTRVSRARFWRSPVGIPVDNWHEGERVLVADLDEYYYPAEVVLIEDDRLTVQLLAGREFPVTPELLRPYDLAEGMAVEARWKGGDEHFPGRIVRLEGDKAQIAYDDGDEEWTTVRLLRVAEA